MDISNIDEASALVISAVQEVDYSRHLTPTNLAAAREDFVANYAAAGRRVNPRFEYDDAPAAQPALDRASAAISTGQPLHDVLAGELDTARRAYAALVSRSAAEMTDYSLATFGHPDRTVLEAARRYLDEVDAPPTDSLPAYSAQEAADVLAAVLRGAGLPDWTVETPEHMVARMSVLGPKRRVRVRPGATFTLPELRRLVVHEIGTHVFRTANASRQTIRLLGHGLAGYLHTEEGLAVWHEERAGLTAVDVTRRYALRYVACDAALRGDFHSVVDELIGHTTMEEAFQIAVRVKRGLVDTSAPGGFLKDMAYFGGVRDVAAHLAQHPDDYPLLMATKWPITRAPLLRDLARQGLLAPARYDTDIAVRLAATLPGAN
ncbi:tyrosine/phenylalanine carboxypeptidase domain-containing protein [Micromonospora sp. CA-263727]|uniref:tyrosine/phenylalanine carboxypeptidase domain-containing protein n=1 Tax=Micromonospora sp. CA-263727 TaxID=3239967 RepID=UPI003D8A7847